MSVRVAYRCCMSASIDARDAKYLTFYALSYTLDLILRQTADI